MTSSDGKQLEALVSFVEGTLLPTGFEVKTNERIFNDDGVQIAEFDIEINGKVGSTTISWLIECRDRPSNGPAPGSWIEQLVGRRDRFGFNKVTAVSTTGFAQGATDYAKQKGIELREVKALTPDAFEWLQIREMQMEHRFTKLHRASLFIEEPTNERAKAFEEALLRESKDAAFLKSTKTGKKITAANAFLSAINQAGSIWEDVQPNTSGKKIQISGKYKEGDHFVVETRLGEIAIIAIDFHGELEVKEISIPVVTNSSYEHTDNTGVISQFVAFEPHEMLGHNFSLELHRMGENGATYVRLRAT